jgi:hypothetical protein
VRRQHFRYLARGSKINPQAARAESAHTVLTKTAQATPETDREPAFGERWGVTTSSKFKARNFCLGGLRPLAPVQSGGARGRVGALECRDIRLR